METVLQEKVRQEVEKGTIRRFWRVLAWLALACGAIAYFVGWGAAITQTQVWNIPTQIWFYDAVAAVAFAIFFMMYAAESNILSRRYQA